MYSFALTFQNLGVQAQKIPRVFLVIIGTVIYVILAIVGENHFEEWLDTLLIFLSYWLAIYATIVIEEHLIFRKGIWSNYNPDDYDTPSYLPLGLAAAVAAGFGVMGAVFGMATTWCALIVVLFCGLLTDLSCFQVHRNPWAQEFVHLLVFPAFVTDVHL